jgi:hypothetical protein
MAIRAARIGNKKASEKVWMSMKKCIQQERAQLEDTVLLKLSETEISSVVTAAGGRYVGIVKELPGKMDPVVLFISLRTRTTLSISISRLTVEAVRDHLAQSDATFAEAGAK